MPTINLYNTDCMEFMRNVPDKYYDLAIVDPPYGINADVKQNKAADARIRSNGKSKAGRGWALYKTTEWDKSKPIKNYWEELFRISKNQIVFGGNYFTEFLPPSMGWIVWKALRIFEMSRGKSLVNNKESGGRFHPTQKPVALYKWILTKYAKQGNKILDTHGGSMSISIACHDLGFDLDLCELDKDYYQAGVKRYNLHTSQQKLFV